MTRDRERLINRQRRGRLCVRSLDSGRRWFGEAAIIRRTANLSAIAGRTSNKPCRGGATRRGRCEHAKIPFPSSAGRSAEGKLPVRLPRRKRHLSPACLPRLTRSPARAISSFGSLPCRVARDNRSRRENDARVGARERKQQAVEPGDIRYSLYASVFQVSD